MVFYSMLSLLALEKTSVEFGDFSQCGNNDDYFFLTPSGERALFSVRALSLQKGPRQSPSPFLVYWYPKPVKPSVAHQRLAHPPYSIYTVFASSQFHGEKKVFLYQQNHLLK